MQRSNSPHWQKHDDVQWVRFICGALRCAQSSNSTPTAAGLCVYSDRHELLNVSLDLNCVNFHLIPKSSINNCVSIPFQIALISIANWEHVNFANTSIYGKSFYAHMRQCFMQFEKAIYCNTANFHFPRSPHVHKSLMITWGFPWY